MEFMKFASIEQLRTVIKDITHQTRSFVNEEGERELNHSIPLPVVDFLGRVKIHGTNGGIVLDTKTNELSIQSRNRILTLDSDNAGFAGFVELNKDHFISTMQKVADTMVAQGLERPEYVLVFGEWAGANIQKGVAISQVDKFFSPFELMVDQGSSLIRFKDDIVRSALFRILELKESRIFPIDSFGCWRQAIDIERPGYAQKEIAEAVLEVEANCPVGKFFGVDGIGEGLVYTSLDAKHRFKAKGEKHSASKVSSVAAVDVELIQAVEAFVDYAVTESRLQQGVQYLQEMQLEVDLKNTGHFLKWMVSDIRKEESDVVVGNGLDDSRLNKAISARARKWFAALVNTF